MIKLNIFSSSGKKIAQHIPGTEANIALKKRKLELELRASGLSRKESMLIVSERFGNRV